MELAISICLASMANAATPTLQAIDEIESQALSLLVSEQFDRLNATTDDMRTSKARLPDGRWKLAFVTSGLQKGLAARDESAWQRRLLLIDKWIAKTPDNAAPHLAKASLLISYAWDARGPGYADTVKEGDWVKFHQRLKQAREVLQSSSRVSGNSPVWYESMQTVATGQAWSEDDFQQLFQEGVSKEPTYYFLYFNAANYLLPRWHGSAAKLTKFVDSAVAATKKQEGETLYARIYWSLLWALRDETFSPGYADWRRMRDGFESITRDYPDNWNLNAFTYYACMAGDWKTAQRIGSKLTSVAVNLWKTEETYQRCMQRSP